MGWRGITPAVFVGILGVLGAACSSSPPDESVKPGASPESKEAAKDSTVAPVAKADVSTATAPKSGAATSAATLSTATAVPVNPGVPVKEPSAKDLAADAKRDFDRANALLEKGEESQALISYTDFLRRYPRHALVGDAQYALGEVLFRQRRYRQALDEYLKVKDVMNGKSPKIPFAYLRIGECHQRLGDTERAKIEWNAVIRRFPETPAAEKARIFLKGIP